MHYSRSRLYPQKTKPASKTTIALYKTLTYRLLGSGTSFALGFMLTNNVDTSIAIGLFDLLLKPFLYFVHELIWNKFLR